MDYSWVNYDRPQFATARRKSYGYLVRGSYPQMNELFRCFSSFFFKFMNYIRIHPDRCPFSTMWLSREIEWALLVLSEQQMDLAGLMFDG